MSFYRACMKRASVILFWSAVVLFFASLVVSFGIYQQLFQGPSAGVVISPSSGTGWEFASALLSALNNAVWPFAAAALLYVLEKRGPEAAE